MAQPRTLLEEVQMLREQVEVLHEQNRVLRNLPVDKTLDTMRTLKLTPTLANIVMLLATGRVIPAEEIRRRCCKPDCDPNTVKVHIAKLRGLIKPIEISSRARQGYWLEPAALAMLRNRLGNSQ